MPITDEEQRQVSALVLRDVTASVGVDCVECDCHDLVTSVAASQREFYDNYVDYLHSVTEDVQQLMHDLRIDTTWPACPRHPNHPLWVHSGWWCCGADRIVRIGELESLLR